MPRGRPALAVGTHGELKNKKLSEGTWEAHTFVRDPGGVTRRLKRRGATKKAAEQALLVAVRDVVRASQGDITPDTKMPDLCSLYLKKIKESRSVNTVRVYRLCVKNQIKPKLGGYRVRDLTPGVVDRCLDEIRREYGAHVARTSRSVLGGVLAIAVRQDALATNPVREAERAALPKPSAKGEFTKEELVYVRKATRATPRTVARDLPELFDFLIVTGLRISEAIAIEWDAFNFATGYVKVGEAMVMREGKDPETGEPGRGLFINRDYESLKLTPRELALPTWFLRVMEKRRANATSSVVFPSPRGMLRDPSNTSQDIKDALRDIGFEWATAHSFRSTLATAADRAGYSSREAADQLGHSKVSMVEDSYYQRSKQVDLGKKLTEDLDDYTILEEGDGTTHIVA